MDHLIDNGKLIRAGDDWQEERDISWADLPRSVETVLSTQLSSLDETLLSIFQAAAIEGDQFTVEVIAGVLDMSPMNTAKILARRAPANLVETVGTYHIDGSRVTKYRFCYSLARRFVYNQIDDVERIYLHEAVAKQIQSLAGDNGESLAAQIAYHFEHAEVYDRAAFYHEQAAIYAKTTCSLVESDKHFRKALKFSGEDQEKLRITWSLAKNSSQIGSIDEALDLIIAARVMAEDRSDEDLLSILSYESLYLFLLNRLDESEDLTLKTLALAKDDGNEQVQAILWDTLGRIHGMRGQLDEAVTAAEHAVELAEKQPDIATIARCYAGLGWNLKQVGRYSDALSVLEDNLSLIAREDLDLSIASDTHNSIADCYISLEDYAPAREHLEIAIEYWKNFDQVASASIALNNLANLANREALYTEALTFAEEALIMDRKNFGEQHPGVAFPLCCIGESYLGLTRFSDAVAVLQQALEIRLNNEVSEGALAWTKWLLGRALVESGEGINQGIEHVKEARSVLESMGVAAESELGDIDRWMSEMKPGAI